MSNAALNRTVASCYDNGSTNIPLPISYGRSSSCPEKWKIKYEDTEKKRKTLLTQNERTSREYSDLERKFLQLKLHNTVVQNELSEKTDQLNILRNVSQKFYKEYDTLKNQYNNETNAMHKALSVAEKWYKQSRELKRMSARLSDGNEILCDVVDSNDIQELEGLKDSIKDLSANNAKLQTELNEAKLAEFEATEQVINLTQETEVLQRRCNNLETELRDIKERNEQLVRVSKMVSKELEDIKSCEEKHRENVVSLRTAADDAKRERNVLAHQSALLLQTIASEDDKMILLQEIEQLKRSLEDTTNKYEREIVEMQEKLEDHDKFPQLEVTEERLLLADAELRHALNKIEELEKQLTAATTPSLPPPPPPLPSLPIPPPPPPLPVAMSENLNITNRKIPLPKDLRPTVTDLSSDQQNGIDNIINQIKGGQFTLRSTKNQQKPREEPKAVGELLQILGTLRRNPKPRNSMCISDTTDF